MTPLNALPRPAVQARLRRPAVAGYLYPSEPAALRSALESFRPSAGVKLVRPFAAVVPHGSYVWAGRVIGSALGAAALPRRIVIVGPSHTGRAGGWSVLPAGAYETPLGEARIDEELAADLQDLCPFIETDHTAQFGEHAIEVLVPFLQHFGPDDLAILPVLCGNADALERVQVAAALAGLVRASREPVLLIASSDLSHYEPAARADTLDRLLIDRLCAVDPDGLVRVSREHRTRMCGDDAAACVLQAAALLGADSGHLTARTTSAAQGGDPDSAIGYASLLIT